MHMTKYHFEIAGAEVIRLSIEALDRNQGHMKMRRARLPHVAKPKRTRWGEDSREVRTHPSKQGRGVINKIGGQHVGDHVDQDKSDLSRWQGNLRPTAQGEAVVNDLSRVIMSRSVQKDGTAELVGEYDIKNQMQMDEIQHTHLLNVNNTYRLEFRAYDGTVYMKLP
jgi:hypothetical protein